MGLDLLGLARLELKNHVYNSVQVVGVLDHTFGNPYPKLVKFKHLKLIRVHLLNGTLNNHACAPRYTQLIRAKNRLYQFSLNHPKIDIYASPSLEHGCTRKGVVHRWFSKLSKFIPVCSAYKGYCPKNVLIEKHGANARGDIASNDGAALGKLRGKVINLLWHPCMNGRQGLGPEFLPPSERLGYCSKHQLHAVVQLLSSLSAPL